MEYNFKRIMAKPERLAPGHRMCAGCGGGIAARGVLRALKEEDEAVICCATGCMEVSTFMYPYTAWKDSFIHSAFENAGATISGAEAAYKALRRSKKVNKNYKFIAFGGDGGTYDIGFQSLSGAMERGHDMTYVCYDNGAYMNTGIQRSSATPQYADTTTTPVGTQSVGKVQVRKNMTEIMKSHNIPYAAQTTFTKDMKDFYQKSEKAIYTQGASFLNVLAPCPRGWRYPEDMIMDICKLAIDTCWWPMYEVVDGKYNVTYIPKKKLPIEEFLKPQGRFKHLFKKENKHLIADIQKRVDTNWENILAKCN